MQNLHYQLARYADIAAAVPIGCTPGHSDSARAEREGRFLAIILGGKQRPTLQLPGTCIDHATPASRDRRMFPGL
jgi:hypothetical protein